MKWKNNDIYEGEWQNDKINGKGKFQWGNGSIYFGSWVNNNIEGFGKFTQ